MALTPEAFVGMGVILALGLAGTLLILKKLGIVRFGINDKYTASIHESFLKLRDEHFECVPMVKRHDEQLKEGKSIFAEIRDDVQDMKISLALIKQKLEIKE